MDVADALVWSHNQLVEIKVPHALIGGMALSEHGYSRGTQDVAWLIPEEHQALVSQHFQGLGFTLFHESAEVLQLSGKAEIDFLIARRPISRAMIENSVYSDQLQMPVVLVEDLIGLKIQAYKNNAKRKLRDLADIQELTTCNPRVNWERIKFYADHFQEWETLRTLQEGSE